MIISINADKLLSNPIAYNDKDTQPTGGGLPQSTKAPNRMETKVIFLTFAKHVTVSNVYLDSEHHA